MRIYILKIDGKIYKIEADGLDSLSEKLFILAPKKEFVLLAINYPNIRIKI